MICTKERCEIGRKESSKYGILNARDRNAFSQEK